MKQKDVKTQGHYLTKVGKELVEIIVTYERINLFDGNRKTYVVKRADNGRPLPKARTAAALRLMTEG